MTETNDDEKTHRKLAAEEEAFHREVAARAKRSRQARAEGDRSFRFGVRSFGAIGWSIVVPALIGIFVGLWLDRRFGGGSRFTLSLFVGGLLIGMINVWNWMNAE